MSDDILVSISFSLLTEVSIVIVHSLKSMRDHLSPNNSPNLSPSAKPSL